MIIATAGHVDHGKTALIKQLTGVDTDRLEEERRRGLSINLGYAYLPTPDGMPLGFIDVPGHRRFINTMIAGISGIDMGMLLVAADDGIMPQTVEHLDVLRVLGVPRLIVVINKADRVDAKAITDLQAVLTSWLEDRAWPHVQIFATSAVTGEGVEALKVFLLEASRETQERAVSNYFRLSIDRAFKLKGAGQIVTGTASAGSVSVDDSLIHLPSQTALRVRGLRVHDAAAQVAHAGTRVALNLTGKTDAASLSRGDWLVEPPLARMSVCVSVELSLLDSIPFALKHMAPIKLHIGAKRVGGRVALLAPRGRRLEAGARALAQLVLEEPINSVWGERFLLRDHAEDITLGGGRVLDPLSVRAGRSKAQVTKRLHALQADSIGEALQRLTALDSVIDLSQFGSLANLRVDDISALIPDKARTFTADKKRYCVKQALWVRGAKWLKAFVQRWHEQHPDQPGVRLTELKAAFVEDFQAELAMSILVSKIQANELKLDEGIVSRKDFKVKAPSAQQANRYKIEHCLQTAGLALPLLSELQAKTGLSPDEIASALKPAVKAGTFVKITESRYALPEHIQLFAEKLEQAKATGEPLTVAVLKTYFGAGRKLTIEILEYFDSIRYTRRVGDAREVIDSERPAAVFNRQ
ncbi:MAG: selenocysteine-specific translation elongation factor [Pseudomonadota bacterium]